MSTFISSPAAVLTQYQTELEVWDISIPDPEPRALIVEVLAATMCGTDAHIFDGDFADTSSHLPLVMGHETVGRIVEMGAGIRRDALGRELKVGDRIAWAYAWCGQCYWCCIAKQPTLCQFGRQYGWGPADRHPYLTGGYAHYTYVMPECDVVLVPEGLDDAVAASMTCAFRTIVHGFERAGGVTPLDNVVIQGSGAVGLYALAYALGSGARHVTVIGAPDARLDVATNWGATQVLSVEATNPEERTARVRETTAGRGADLVVECAGNRHALEEGFRLVRRGGRLLVIGQSDPKPTNIQGTSFNIHQVSVTGSVSADISHFHRALQFAADARDRFPFQDLLGNEYGLGNVTEAIGAIATGKEMRPIIRPRK